jgi:NitT/TauT family transport system ATP-binding protein
MIPAVNGAGAPEGGTTGVAVRIEGIRKDFRGRDGHTLTALDGVDLSIPPGQFASILGPSGCGKTTLLKLVGGLESATDGLIAVGDQVVRRPYTEAGFVFQSDLLLEWRSALDNVLLQAEMRGLPRWQFTARAQELLQMVGLAGFERHPPSQLSGGMRQRVAICRALLMDFPILLMDEPFGALDALTRDQMAIDLQHVVRGGGKTVLFVTHSIDEAIFLSDRVIVMTPRPGAVAADLMIELSRPRRIEVKDGPQFDEYASTVRKIFLESGVLVQR